MIATKDSFEPSTVRSSAVGQADNHLGHHGKNDGNHRGKTAEDGHSSEQLPGSKRVYIAGKLHPDVCVPMREIELAPAKSHTGAIEPNEPVRVYDCSGPWGDPEFKGTVEEGLPALRAKWIRARGDVEEH